MTTTEHFDKKWKEIIAKMPQGGDYNFYMRQYGYDIIKDAIEKNSAVFDFACGLGVIDKQLYSEKGCEIHGCDISRVAVRYANAMIGERVFKVSDKIYKYPYSGGSKYDYILAIYFIEHIPDPVGWLNTAFKYGNKVIFSIPNNFKQAGEHILMKWHDWPSFYALFSEFDIKRIDEGKYHPWLPEAYHHPTFICEKK